MGELFYAELCSFMAVDTASKCAMSPVYRGRAESTYEMTLDCTTYDALALTTKGFQNKPVLHKAVSVVARRENGFIDDDTNPDDFSAITVSLCR